MNRNSPGFARRMRGIFLFGPMYIIGIFAAIAIPAYQDYTIRSQVIEGLNLASSVKAAVIEHHVVNGKWPADLKQLDISSGPHGRFATSVTVESGAVVIVYGGQAARVLHGHRLTLRPTVTPEGDIVWTCGFNDPKAGAAAPATDIPPKYLPKGCR